MREKKIRRIIFLFFRILLQKKKREKKNQIHAYLMHTQDSLNTKFIKNI